MLQLPSQAHLPARTKYELEGGGGGVKSGSTRDCVSFRRKLRSNCAQARSCSFIFCTLSTSKLQSNHHQAVPAVNKKSAKKVFSAGRGVGDQLAWRETPLQSFHDVRRAGWEQQAPTVRGHPPRQRVKALLLSHRGRFPRLLKTMFGLTWTCPCWWAQEQA